MRKFVLSVFIWLLSAAAAFASEPIKIGYLAALTGNDAAFGIAEAQSAQMYVTKRNAEGGVLGRPLELVVYDSKSRPEDAVNAVRRMIESDRVVAIVGSNTSGINIATAALVNAAKVPQIGTATTNPLVTVDAKGNVRPYSFRLAFDDPYQGFLGADFALRDLGVKKAAILYNIGSDYSHGLREYFVNYFVSNGGEIVADESYRPDDVDFRAQLTKIKQTNPEILFMPGMGKDMALIIKQAHELGMGDIEMMGGDGYGDFMAEITGPALEGCYFMTVAAYPTKPSLQPILQLYRDTYNEEPREYGNVALAFDGMEWLCYAITQAGSTDGTAIAKALENTKNLELSISPLTIDPKTHNPYKRTGFILRINHELHAEFHKEVTPE